MNKRDRTAARMFEIIHPVMLVAIVGIIVYTVYENRVDAWVLRLYLAGFCLLPLSAVVRTAIGKVRSMWAYVLISGTVFAMTAAAGYLVSDKIFVSADGMLSRVPSMILLMETIIGGGWITQSALMIRVRENRRDRARIENDYTWRERSIWAEKPHVLFVSLFVLAYLAGLFNACPPVCNIAIAGGMLYFVLALVYRSLDVEQVYLEETRNLANVPGGKISRIRVRLLAALISLMCIAALSAVLTADQRTYRDIRKWELQGVKIRELYGEQETGPGSEIMKEIFGLGIMRERRDPPAWLLAFEQVLSTALFFAVIAALLYSVWRSVTGTAKDFARIPEENGDEAKQLDDIFEQMRDPDSVGARIRRLLGGKALTQEEKIRREYRQAIRRYRKDVPAKSDTPAQIEAGTDFPDSFDTRGLHDRYEKARYGR